MKHLSALICLSIGTRRQINAAFVLPPTSIADAFYRRRTLRIRWQTFAGDDTDGTRSTSVTEDRENTSRLHGVGDRDLDPLIQRKLWLLSHPPSAPSDSVEETETDTDNDETSSRMNKSVDRSVQVRVLLQANRGIQTWRSCLLRGRLPVWQDFDDAAAAWPAEPLFAKVSQTMARLELPRLVLRHAELVDSVLLSLLVMVLEFQQAKEQGRAVGKEEEDDDDVLPDTNDGYWEESSDDDEYQEEEVEEEIPHTFQPLSEEELGALADELVSSGLMDEWGGIVGGISALDRLFGANHGLLLNNDDTLGFGTEDGVWQHTGWKTLTQLQQEQLASMPELKQLLNQLGRRPTAQQSDAMHRFAPRKLDPEGGLGAQLDVHRRESVSGLTLSGSLSEMLPSEAVLLKGSPALRRLFLAKKVESKL